MNIADGFGAVKEEKEKRLICADLSTSWKCVLSNLFTNSSCLHTTLCLDGGFFCDRFAVRTLVLM